MKRYLIPVFLVFLCFIMPVQIYIMGDGIGAGIQGAFYRYQESSYGSSLILVNQDVHYVSSGIYGGKTALSILIWLISDILLVFTTVMSLIAEKPLTERNAKIMCSCIVACGVLFLISLMFQYGVLLHSPAGISFPFGIPLILILGLYFYKVKDLLD